MPADYFTKYESPNIVIVPTMSFINNRPTSSSGVVHNVKSGEASQNVCTTAVQKSVDLVESNATNNTSTNLLVSQQITEEISSNDTIQTNSQKKKKHNEVSIVNDESQKDVKKGLSSDNVKVIQAPTSWASNYLQSIGQQHVATIKLNLSPPTDKDKPQAKNRTNNIPINLKSRSIGCEEATSKIYSSHIANSSSCNTFKPQVETITMSTQAALSNIKTFCEPNKKVVSEIHNVGEYESKNNSATGANINLSTLSSKTRYNSQNISTLKSPNLINESLPMTEKSSTGVQNDKNSHGKGPSTCEKTKQAICKDKFEGLDRIYAKKIIHPKSTKSTLKNKEHKSDQNKIKKNASASLNIESKLKKPGTTSSESLRKTHSTKTKCLKSLVNVKAKSDEKSTQEAKLSRKRRAPESNSDNLIKKINIPSKIVKIMEIQSAPTQSQKKRIRGDSEKELSNRFPENKNKNRMFTTDNPKNETVHNFSVTNTLKSTSFPSNKSLPTRKRSSSNSETYNHSNSKRNTDRESPQEKRIRKNSDMCPLKNVVKLSDKHPRIQPPQNNGSDDDYESTFDLRSRLSRSNKYAQHLKKHQPQNDNQFEKKTENVRENLIITVNNEDSSINTNPTPGPSKPNKPKGIKYKKIKLIIDVVCQDSEENSESSSSEDSNSGHVVLCNTAPSDLSFLDDFNIDEIVNSLKNSPKRNPIQKTQNDKEQSHKTNNTENLKNLTDILRSKFVEPINIKNEMKIECDNTTEPVISHNSNFEVSIETSKEINSNDVQKSSSIPDVHLDNTNENSTEGIESFHNVINYVNITSGEKLFPNTATIMQPNINRVHFSSIDKANNNEIIVADSLKEDNFIQNSHNKTVDVIDTMLENNEPYMIRQKPSLTKNINEYHVSKTIHDDYSISQERGPENDEAYKKEPRPSEDINEYDVSITIDDNHITNQEIEAENKKKYLNEPSLAKDINESEVSKTINRDHNIINQEINSSAHKNTSDDVDMEPQNYETYMKEPSTSKNIDEHDVSKTVDDNHIINQEMEPQNDETYMNDPSPSKDINEHDVSKTVDDNHIITQEMEPQNDETYMKDLSPSKDINEYDVSKTIDDNHIINQEKEPEHKEKFLKEPSLAKDINESEVSKTINRDHNIINQEINSSAHKNTSDDVDMEPQNYETYMKEPSTSKNIDEHDVSKTVDDNHIINQEMEPQNDETYMNDLSPSKDINEYDVSKTIDDNHIINQEKEPEHKEKFLKEPSPAKDINEYEDSKTINRDHNIIDQEINYSAHNNTSDDVEIIDQIHEVIDLTTDENKSSKQNNNHGDNILKTILQNDMTSYQNDNKEDINKMKTTNAICTDKKNTSSQSVVAKLHTDEKGTKIKTTTVNSEEIVGQNEEIIDLTTEETKSSKQSNNLGKDIQETVTENNTENMTNSTQTKENENITCNEDGNHKEFKKEMISILCTDKENKNTTSIQVQPKVDCKIDIPRDEIKKKTINVVSTDKQKISETINIKPKQDTSDTQNNTHNKPRENTKSEDAKANINSEMALAGQIEKRISGYMHKTIKVISLIHVGKYSKVFKCKGTSGENYAIKILSNGANRFSQGVMKEDMLKSLQNDIPKQNLNVVYLINGFAINKSWGLLMEYYPVNLYEALTVKGPFHIDRVQELSRQLVTAVMWLKHHEIVHSDIKSSHILLNATHQTLKLCGFDDSYYYSHRSTKLLPNIGTLRYRAPEIILGYSASYSIDVWSSAVIIYEMATNNKLFHGIYNNDILFSQMSLMGKIPMDIVEQSLYKRNHFMHSSFMKRYGPSGKNVVFYDEFYKNTGYMHRSMLNVYYNVLTTKKTTKREKSEAREKIVSMCYLLEQMLAMDPRQRLAIEFVCANPFMYENFS